MWEGSQCPQKIPCDRMGTGQEEKSAGQTTGTDDDNNSHIRTVRTVRTLTHRRTGGGSQKAEKPKSRKRDFAP